MAGRILHLTDIHFGLENGPAVAAVGEIARAEPPDLVAITGDITQFGTREEFAAARCWADALPSPVLVTPGNHDVPYAAPARLFAPFARYRRYFGDPWASELRTGDLVARTLNTARGTQWRWNWSKGVVNRGQVEAAGERLLNPPSGALRAVLCHHPLMEVTGGPMTGKVKHGAAGLAVLARYGAEVVLTGHVHTAFAHELPPFGIYAIGAATLSFRERGQPAGFNIIEWDEDCIQVRAQGWTGSHFETIRTWALPRKTN